MIQGATSQKRGSKTLQHKLDQRIEQGAYLNKKFVVKMAEQMYMIPHTSGKRNNEDRAGILLYDQPVPRKDGIEPLGGWIDHRLNFKAHTAMAAGNTRRSVDFVWRIVKRKGVTLGAIYHLAMSTTVLTML